eukprot:SAG11_NODE_36161_length_263_cov_0.621951_1_plen_36_part_01
MYTTVIMGMSVIVGMRTTAAQHDVIIGTTVDCRGMG